MALFDDASLVTTPNGYKAGTLYSIKPTSGAGDMDVVRATTATRVNSAGLIESVAINVPRLDYTDSTCPSLLVEPQRTNLLKYSEQFDNAAWVKGTGGSISSNSVISPDGTQNADAYTWATSTSSFAYLSQQAIGISQNPNTFSVWLKRPFGSGSRTIRLSISDLSVSTANSSTFTVTEAWQRFEFTRASASATGLLGVGLFVGASGTSIAAGEILDVWGAQLEAGSYPTSYIPTTSAAVTRNADVISKTGISSLIGQTEGTLYFEVQGFSDGNPANQFITLNDGTSNNQIGFHFTLTLGRITGYFRVNSVTYQITSTVLKTLNSKIILKYNSSNVYTLFINGSLIGTGTAASSFSSPLTAFKISQGNGSSPYNGKIKSIVLYQTALTNDQCIDLTT